MRIGRLAVATTALVMVATGCTYALADETVTAGCGTLEFEINDHGLDPTGSVGTAIAGAFDRFGAVIGRDVSFLGATSATYENHTPDDVVLVELAWPEEAPSHLGYAEAHVVGTSYRSGWMVLHPTVAEAPAGLVRRLVLHELGHLHGLLDVEAADELMNPDLVVDDYGLGDIWGLIHTHDGLCG